MRDPNRIFTFCIKFSRVWHDYFPDLRFWQVLSVVAGYLPNDYFKKDPFYAEEEDWREALDAIKKEYEKNHKTS